MDFLALPIHDPVLTIFVVLLMLLLAPLLAEKLKLPGVVGLILAGVAIGPYGLGLLERDKTMELLGTIGLLYIMFIAGLEIDIAQFKKNKVHSISFGILSFLLPLGLGAAAGFFVFAMPPPAAVLFGAIFSTQTLLPYPIVSRMGLSKSRSVTAVVGATIITDTFAMVVLAVVSAAVKGTFDLMFWVRLCGFLSLYVVFSVLVIPPLASLFFKKVRSDGIVDFVFVLAIMFLSGALSKAAGLEPIIGAFLSGLLLNRLIPETSVLMNRIQFAGNALFIPFFLVSVGMLVDIRLFANDPVAIFTAIAMIVLNFGAKFLSSAFTKPLLGYSGTEAALVFGLSVNHAAAALAVVLVGYNVGLFNASILNGTIVMMTVSCLVGPFVTQYAGKKLAMEGLRAQDASPEVPERIMVPLANPEAAAGLLELAFAVRDSDSRDPVYPVSIVLDSIDVERDIARSEKLLAQAVVRGVSANVSVIPVTRVAMNVADGVVQAAKDVRISVILLGWNGVPQLRQRAFGGIIDQVILSSKQTVMVTRVTVPLNTINHVVAVFPPLIDKQPGFAEAVRMAKRLSSRLGAKLHVYTLNHCIDDMRKAVDFVMPSVQAHCSGLAGWDSLCAHAKRAAPSNCAFFMLNVRPGRLAWQPALEKIPGMVMEAYRDVSMFIMYLPDEAREPLPVSESANSSKRTTLFAEALGKNQVAVAMQETAIMDGIRALLDRGFKDAAAVHRLAAMLLEIAQREPVELRPGVVLLHAHIPDVPETKMFFGVNPKGFRLLSASEPAKVIVLLLAPESLAPEDHLKNLADIARMMRNDDFLSGIIACKTTEDAEAVSR